MSAGARTACVLMLLVGMAAGAVLATLADIARRGSLARILLLAAVLGVLAFAVGVRP